ncbi:hypothetical protein BX600DRAFT_544458, partial [Xylariales sp. PMI_506]
MQTPFCDGLPVAYSALSHGCDSSPQLCTTQSPAVTDGYSHMESIQGSSAGSSADETTDLDDYYGMRSPTAESPATLTSWSTASSSADSPASWASPEVQQLNLPPSSWGDQDIPRPANLRICMDISPESGFHQHMGESSYMSQQYHMEYSNGGGSSTPISPPEVMQLASSGYAGVADEEEAAADSKAAVSSYPPLCGDEAQHHHQNEQQQQEDDDDSKAQENRRGVSRNPNGPSYAQLIYEAFLSRESHSMTLQELYQWFRENTNKISIEGKGWQNSIRHNLSMNH